MYSIIIEDKGVVVMPAFYKISKDLENVYLFKSLFVRDFKDEEIEKKATKVLMKQFMGMLPDDVSEKLDEMITFYKQANQSIFSIEASKYTDKNSKYIKTVWNFSVNKGFIDDKNSKTYQVVSGLPKKDERKALEAYVRENYGTEFYNNTLQSYVDNCDVFDKYFVVKDENIKEISKEEYVNFVSGYRNQLTAKNMENLIKNSKNKTSKLRK